MIFCVAAIAASLLLAWDLASQLKKHALAFYAGALALDGACIAADRLGWEASSSPVLSLSWSVLDGLVGRGTLAFFLFAVVMFTGCMRIGSGSRMRLKQVREETAWTAAILALGHMASRAHWLARGPWHDAAFGSGLEAGPMAAGAAATGSSITGAAGAASAAAGSAAAEAGFAIACIASMLMLMVLTASSVPMLKERISMTSWKRLHCLAYPFFVLCCVHAAWACALAERWPEAVLNLAVGATYAALRLRARRLD